MAQPPLDPSCILPPSASVAADPVTRMRHTRWLLWPPVPWTVRLALVIAWLTMVGASPDLAKRLEGWKKPLPNIASSFLVGCVLSFEVFHWKLRRADRWRRNGCCGACGYDLLGTPRCPECGRVAEP